MGKSKQLQKVKDRLDRKLHHATVRLNDCRQEAQQEVLKVAKNFSNTGKEEIEFWTNDLLRNWEKARNLRDFVETAEDALRILEKEIKDAKAVEGSKQLQEARNRNNASAHALKRDKYRALVEEYDRVAEKLGPERALVWWRRYHDGEIDPEEMRKIVGGA